MGQTRHWARWVERLTQHRSLVSSNLIKRSRCLLEQETVPSGSVRGVLERRLHNFIISCFTIELNTLVQTTN